ncbi:hypothetical protein BHM03_00057547 [Ensete ventricosum]|nr:hypothetical protein BHM03_00057547 [Ensete ventricosum]
MRPYRLCVFSYSSRHPCRSYDEAPTERENSRPHKKLKTGSWKLSKKAIAREAAKEVAKAPPPPRGCSRDVLGKTN